MGHFLSELSSSSSLCRYFIVSLIAITIKRVLFRYETEDYRGVGDELLQRVAASLWFSRKARKGGGRKMRLHDKQLEVLWFTLR